MNCFDFPSVRVITICFLPVFTETIVPSAEYVSIDEAHLSHPSSAFAATTRISVISSTVEFLFVSFVTVYLMMLPEARLTRFDDLPFEP